MRVIICLLSVLVGFFGLSLVIQDLSWFGQWGTWETTSLEFIARTEENLARIEGREFSSLNVYGLWVGVPIWLVLMGMYGLHLIETRRSVDERGNRRH